MKNKISLLALILISLFASRLSFGQENEIHDPKFGLGVSLFNLIEQAYNSEYGLSNSIYFTLNVGKQFRLEPTIAFFLADGYNEYSIGIGAFGIKPITKFNFIYGLRLGLNKNETIVIAPAIGGEYYFIKNFSIGSEVQLRGRIHEGDWSAATNSSVIIRFYFL